MNETCNSCIWILEEWSKQLGISYEAINVWLFMIIQPLLIIFGCISTIKCANTKSWNVKNNLKCASYIILILGTIFTFVLVTLPYVMVGIEGK